MTNLAYLSVLLFSISGMTFLDWRYKLAYFKDARSTMMSVLVGIAVFIIWDILGINLGIFFAGQSSYMSGIFLAPDFPLEELFFLYFLCYFSLILYRLLEVKWPRI